MEIYLKLLLAYVIVSVSSFGDEPLCMYTVRHPMSNTVLTVVATYSCFSCCFFFFVCACVSVWVWIVVRLRGRNRCRKSKRHSAAAAAGSNPPIQLAFFSPVGSSSSQRLGSRVSQKEVAKEGRLHMHLKFFATTKPATRKKKKLEKKTSNDLLPSLFLFCATFSH